MSVFLLTKIVQVVFLSIILDTCTEFTKILDPNIPLIEQWNQAEVNEILQKFEEKGGYQNNFVSFLFVGHLILNMQFS